MSIVTNYHKFFINIYNKNIVINNYNYSTDVYLVKLKQTESPELEHTFNNTLDNVTVKTVSSLILSS